MFTIAGGHWTVLQTVAWAEMLHAHAQRGDGLAAAAEQTFDGQHPCALCRDIQAAKAKERQRNPVTPDAKKDAKAKALLTDVAFCPADRMAEALSFPRAAASFAPSRIEPPPTPPPRRGDLAA